MHLAKADESFSSPLLCRELFLRFEIALKEPPSPEMVMCCQRTAANALLNSF